MLDTETKRRIDTCRDILVGKVPDPKSQVEQITIALIYKFMDDMDAEAEELGGERNFFTGEFARYGWSKLMAPGLGGHEMLSLYAEAIQRMNENPGIPALFRDIFKNAFLPYRDPETLRSFLKEINTFTYDHSERLGDAFEYLLSVLGSQGEAGQFRTPRHIIDFMVEITDPKKDETILDPACGTAGFLISAYKHILKHNSTGYQEQQDHEAYDEKGVPVEELALDNPLRYSGDQLAPDDRKRIATNIGGYDISPDMVRLSLVNMYLHGFIDPHIEEYDTLTSDEKWPELADVILANPPFMSPKGGIRPHNRFAVQSKRSEVLFVDYIAEHLTPNGRAAVVVPEGIIFQSQTAYRQLREILVKNYLVAVISLPAGVFNPYSGVKTSILVLDKRLAKQRDEVLFVKVENDGFNLGAQRRPIDKNDLPGAVRTVKAFLQQGEVAEQKNVLAVNRQRIGENGEWNLSVDRYVANDAAVSQYKLVGLADVFLEIRNGINVHQSDEIGKYRVTRIQTISDGTVDLAKTKWTDDEVDASRFMRRGDILLSHINSYDHLAKTALYDLEDEDVIHGINLIRLRPDQELLIPKFAAYLFKQLLFVDKVRSFAQRAVNQASIKVTDLKTIQIPLPPLEVQKEIVAEIEGYQKIIDGARQVVENYQPRIPIHPDWPMVAIKEVAQVESGFGFPLVHQGAKDKPYPFLKVSDMNLPGNETRITVENNTVDSDDLAALKARTFPAGTVIFPKIGAAIATNKKRVLTKESTFDNNVMGIVPNPDSLIPEFLYTWLLNFDLSRWASDAQPPSMRKTTVEAHSIPVPDIDTQKRLVDEVEAEQRLVDANNELIHLFEEKIKQAINRVWVEAE